ncbi:hypothetical protein FRC03_000064 [Tulasnella sp. 419]|nr:hypothetical protein FRC03_000064 [Tulasnella sp. 419]
MSSRSRSIIQNRTSENFTKSPTLQASHRKRWRQRSASPSSSAHSDSESDSDTSSGTESSTDDDAGPMRSGGKNPIRRHRERDSIASLAKELAGVSIAELGANHRLSPHRNANKHLSGRSRSIADLGASYRPTTPPRKANKDWRSEARPSKTNRSRQPEIRNFKDSSEDEQSSRFSYPRSHRVDSVNTAIFNRSRAPSKTNSTVSYERYYSESTISATDYDSDDDNRTLCSSPERTPSPSPRRRARDDRGYKEQESPLARKSCATESSKNRRGSSKITYDKDEVKMVNTIKIDSVSGRVRVKVDDWIPRYVQPPTRQKLIDIMMRKDLGDEPGFLYCLEMFQRTEDDRVGYSIIKVGRSMNINRRIRQWRRCCEKRKPPEFLGAFPEPRKVLRSGRLVPGEPMPHHKKLEAFVLAELKDIALHSSHLRNDFDPYMPVLGMRQVKLREASKKERRRHAPRPCPHCSEHTAHEEIFFFELKNDENAKLVVTEWNAIVQPVIKRWACFIEEVILQTQPRSGY